LIDYLLGRNNIWDVDINGDGKIDVSDLILLIGIGGK